MINLLEILVHVIDRSVSETLFFCKFIQSAFICSKLTIETLGQGVKYVQSSQ